jgi:signal transduction histidine kinase
VSEPLDLHNPDEIGRLRHYLRTALNTIVGYADVVRRQAKEQGARTEASLMEQAAAAGREGIAIMERVLPVKSYVSHADFALLCSNLRPRVERIGKAVTEFQARAGSACAAEMGKMRAALRDLSEFMRAFENPQPQNGSPDTVVEAAGADAEGLPPMDAEADRADAAVALRYEMHEWLSAIAAATAAPDPSPQKLARILADCERVDQAARQLAALVGKAEMAVQPLDLSDHVRKAGESLHANLPAAVRLRLALTEGLPAIVGDARKIQRLVWHLVANAVEALGGAEGTVTIETGLRHLSEGATAEPPSGNLAAGSYVFLAVEDTGRGMDAATRARVFEPFFSTHTGRRGLGLAASIGIARAHSGAIHLRTAPDKGSRFEVLLPTPDRR